MLMQAGVETAVGYTTAQGRKKKSRQERHDKRHFSICTIEVTPIVAAHGTGRTGPKMRHRTIARELLGAWFLRNGLSIGSRIRTREIHISLRISDHSLALTYRE